MVSLYEDIFINIHICVVLNLWVLYAEMLMFMFVLISAVSLTPFMHVTGVVVEEQ